MNDEWWTWIDYEKFHQLSKRLATSGETFTALDYMAKTPSWAVIGAEERGFDPQETRHFRKKGAAKQAVSHSESSPPSR